MGSIRVNANGTGFVRDGKRWFWLADTCWSAFTNITLDDWAYYLDRRAEQGFNAVQVNTLPQWDRCRPDLGIYPYESADGTLFDWRRPNLAYWERARTMCRMAVERGLQPILVVMWVNFVPKTWGSRVGARSGATPMPREEIRPHVQRVVEYLGACDPIYLVSGDTDFRFPEAAAFYDEVLQAVCDFAPESLRGMHTVRALEELPERFLDRLDFLTIQSGHEAGEQDEAYKLVERYRKRYPGKPLLNAEPCYEHMGACRHVYERFEAADVRAALWSSVLAGGCAGVTYGAHGIWNWKTATSIESELGEMFDPPQRWQEAMQLSGAWDGDLMRRVLLAAGLSDPEAAVEPAQDALTAERPGLRAGRVGRTLLIYMPFATPVRLRTADLPAGLSASGESGPELSAIALDLTTRRVARLAARRADDELAVAQHPFAGDALVVITCGAV